MLQEKRSTWRGFIRKIGMIGLTMLLLLPNMLMVPVSQVFADEGDYEFLQNGETITITRYLGTDTEVNIPEQIMGKEVTVIADQAFFGKKLDTVTIPRTVTTIGLAAFMGSELEAVTFNEGLIEIGLMAFAGSKMEHVDIPGTVTTIGQGAFSQGTLSTLTLREGLKIIEDKAFWDNELLSVTIPDGVTTIGEEAFIDNKLEEVNIPGTVLTVGARAFIGGSDSNNIRTLTLNEGLETIAEGAFSGNSLESVSIPSSVLNLGDSAFADNPLKEVKIYNENMRFGNLIFNGIAREDLTLFGYSGSTTEQLATAYGYKFQILQDDEPYVCGDGTDFECEVNHDGTITITGYTGTSQDVVIPETINEKPVTMIGRSAFAEKNLESVTIPNSVTSISEYAFYTNDLKKITIPESVTSIGEGAFISNPLEEFTVLRSTTSIDPKIFTQGTLPKPEELTIRSYCGSTANELANLLGHSFEQLEADECLTITLTPSERETTNEDVTVTIDVVNGEASEVELKWANGKKDLAYFQDGDGADVIDSQFTVTVNGVYTIYAKDKVGNERVDKIRITNIDKSLLIIHVQMVDGRTMTLHVHGSDSIQQLKQKIQDEEGIEPGNQKVIFAGTILEDGRTLADYNIPSGATLQLNVLSSDASLKKLRVDLKGERTFELDLNNLDHDVGKTVQETIEIFATTNDTKATMTLNGTSFDEQQLLPLNNGENTFIMVVTAENGDKQTYTITVTRQTKVLWPGGGGGGVYIPSDDTSLDLLEANIGGKNVLPFDPTQFKYDLGDTEEKIVEIVAKTHHPKAKITLNGEAFVDEQTLRLNEGKNIFEIMIFAENGDKQTYALSVNRLDKVPFTDIAGHWAEGYIKKTYWDKMFYGYSDQTFRPDNPISRMEVTSVLVRLLQLDERKKVPFTDVQSLGKDAMEELEKAYANGVVKGYPDQTFKSYADVTRAHLALIFYRTYEKVNGTPYQPRQLAFFPDITGYDQEMQHAIAMLVELQIAEGSGGNFMPNEQATRAQVAKMLVYLKEELVRLENNK